MKATMDVKLMSILLVLGIPASALYVLLYLITSGIEIAQEIIILLIFIIMLFPIVISVNILRSKNM